MNYALIYYNEGPICHKCLCEAENCRGQIVGFRDLDFIEKERLLPFVSPAVHAMLRSDLDKGVLNDDAAESRDGDDCKVEDDFKPLSFAQTLGCREGIPSTCEFDEEGSQNGGVSKSKFVPC